MTTQQYIKADIGLVTFDGRYFLEIDASADKYYYAEISASSFNILKEKHNIDVEVFSVEPECILNKRQISL